MARRYDISNASAEATLLHSSRAIEVTRQLRIGSSNVGPQFAHHRRVAQRQAHGKLRGRQLPGLGHVAARFAEVQQRGDLLESETQILRAPDESKSVLVIGRILS